MVAHIWKDGAEWLLELAEGNPVDGWKVIGTSRHANKLDAKRAAKAAGATPWNY